VDVPRTSAVECVDVDTGSADAGVSGGACVTRSAVGCSAVTAKIATSIMTAKKLPNLIYNHFGKPCNQNVFVLDLVYFNVTYRRVNRIGGYRRRRRRGADARLQAKIRGRSGRRLFASGTYCGLAGPASGASVPFSSSQNPRMASCNAATLGNPNAAAATFKCRNALAKTV